MDRMNKAKAYPMPVSMQSRYEKHDFQTEQHPSLPRSAPTQAPATTNTQTVPSTPAPKLTAHSTFSALRKNTPSDPSKSLALGKETGVGFRPSSPVTADDKDISFDPSTPPRPKAGPSSQPPPGLLSHFKSKKTSSAQKALNFANKSPIAQPLFREENITTDNPLDESSFGAKPSTINSPPLAPMASLDSPRREAPLSHFKAKLQLNDTDKPATEVLNRRAFNALMEAPSIPSTSSSSGTAAPSAPPSHFKPRPQETEPSSAQKPRPPANLLRKSETMSPLSDAMLPPPRSDPSPRASSPSAPAPEAFPLHLQATLRQYLDEAMYTSKFSLAGARVVFADIPTHLPLARQKAIYWLAKANVEEEHKAWQSAEQVYKDGLAILAHPLERLIIEAAQLEFQSRLQLTRQPMSLQPINIVVPNQPHSDQKTQLTPEKQREFCSHLLDGTQEDSFIMENPRAMIP
ncbi:unnamed protein product [Aphanomyces euteiches]